MASQGTSTTSKPSTVLFKSQISGLLTDAKPNLTVMRSMCENTCPTARDGLCQDGRPGRGDDAASFYSTLRPVTCDLGTDCADCGTWVAEGTAESRAWAPIAHLRAKGIQLFVKRIASPAGYLFGITDPQLDTDVSKKVHEQGIFEPILTMIWHDILAECVKADGSRRLVLDVGANFGYYTLMAASLGCRVKAWEPVPSFAAFTQYGLLANNLTHLVDLRDKIVSAVDGERLTMTIPHKGIWGTAGVGGSNIDFFSRGDVETMEVETERLDRVVKEDVLLIKADVEGFEPNVMHSARDLLLKHSVDNIIMEYSPGVGEQAKDWNKSMENPQMITGLLNAGYSGYDIPWALEAKFPGFDKPIPVLEKVLASMLVHDIQDMQRANEGTLGCPFPDELTKHKAFLPSCNTLPDGLHPHSYHSSFSHNTNIWLTRRPSVASRGTASVVPLDMNISTTWYLPDNMAMGRRPCGWLRAEHRLGGRCHCPADWACAPAAEALVKAAARGAIVRASTSAVDLGQYSVASW